MCNGESGRAEPILSPTLRFRVRNLILISNLRISLHPRANPLSSFIVTGIPHTDIAHHTDSDAPKIRLSDSDVFARKEGRLGPITGNLYVT